MIAAYVPDLMDWSKLSSLPNVKRVNVEDLKSIDSCEMLLVDLDRLSEIHLATSLMAPVRGRAIGFCSHVNSELREKAQAIGFEVHTRSSFFLNPSMVIWPDNVEQATS